MQKNSWLLPDGVDEILPPHAARLESLRREILDCFSLWGYELVIPPVIEFLHALLSSEDDLDLQTLKVVDQVSGKMMGVRADITPQVARIDAHRLQTDVPQRLCYLGPVVHATPDKFAGSRNPLQIGAELYGHAGIESDAEIACLMAKVLEIAQLEPITLELGHMGVFKALIESAELGKEQESQVLEILLRKAENELAQLLDSFGVAMPTRDLFVALTQLDGGAEIMSDIANTFSDAASPVKKALSDFSALVEMLKKRIPQVNLHLDLAELRGYHYHTGVTFAAYTGDIGRAIAWGGRYDNVGRDFGRARPATGFSADLKILIGISPLNVSRGSLIFAPAGVQESLLNKISELRESGEVVIQALPGQVGTGEEMGCSSELVLIDGEWRRRVY
ncbi:MAG: ATP phosphoribosyltransferase regulatory subunit [Gammaproteobacteria bacterium]